MSEYFMLPNRQNWKKIIWEIHGQKVLKMDFFKNLKSDLNEVCFVGKHTFKAKMLYF